MTAPPPSASDPSTRPPAGAHARRPWLLVAAALGVVALAAGLVLLLLPASAPIGLIPGGLEDVNSVGDGPPITSVDCGNAFTGPHLTGILADIDADTGGPGFFQRMADDACADAVGARHGFGWTLAVVGLIDLLSTGVACFARRTPPPAPATE